MCKYVCVLKSLCWKTAVIRVAAIDYLGLFENISRSVQRTNIFSNFGKQNENQKKNFLRIFSKIQQKWRMHFPFAFDFFSTLLAIVALILFQELNLIKLRLLFVTYEMYQICE